MTGGILKLPSFIMLEEQSIYIKIIWQYLIILIILSPILIMDFFDSGQYLSTLSDTSFLSIFILSILHMLYIYLIYFSATKTFVVHTLLIASMSITFTSTWKVIRSIPFTRIEYLGIGINIFGVYLCCCEYPIIDSNSFLMM